jgi:DNA invertase Pin-like site-specific DNA recombinase
MAKPTPLDIYVRVSRKGSREHFNSPEDQEREARTFAERKGLALTGFVSEDIDKSGGTLDRPGLQEILRRVRDGESGGMVVAYLSRASRETGQGLRLLDEISAAGGSVYAPNLPEDYKSADGKMLTTIQLAIDTGYRERKREELETAKENAIMRGIPVNTRPAVGLRKRKDRTLEPIPELAPLILEVFERRYGGAGPAELGTFLEANDVATSRGSKTWSKEAIYNLIRNPVYKGTLVYGRPVRYKNENALEPIVPPELWEAVQRRPAGARTLAPARTENSPFLLTGLARCAGCRHCLQATTTSHGHRIYRCKKKHAGGYCAAPTRLRAEGVEDAAVDAFWTITANIEAEARHDDLSATLATLDEKIAHAQRLLDQWLAPEMQEAIADATRYADGTRARQNKVDDLVAERGRLAAERRTHDALPSRETLRAAWDRADTQERRNLLSLRFDCLAIAPDGAIVAYPAGTAPTDLPRRGYHVTEVAPFPDLPADARILSLEKVPQPARNGAVR